MKYAICNELYQGFTHEEAFAHAAQLGYTGVELAPFTLSDAPTEMDAAAISAVRQAAQSNHLEVVGLHWLLAKTNGYHLTTGDQAVRRRTAEYLGQLTRLCRELGGSLMVLGSPQQRNLVDGISPAQGQQNAGEVLELLAPTLEKFDVTLAIEPLGPSEGNFLLTAESAVNLIQQVDCPWIRLHLDVKAMSSEDQPIDKIIEANARWLHHFHANDPNLQGPGMGEVDFLPIFGALQRIRYDGWVSVEVFDYAPGVEVLAGGSLRYMQQTESRLSQTSA